MSTRLVDGGGAGATGREGEHRGNARPVVARYSTDWGEGTLTVCDGRLVAVGLPGDPDGHDHGRAVSGAEKAADRAAAERWVRELEAYFRGDRLGWTAEEAGVDELEVGDFRRRVYETLLTVPAGLTVSYGSLAQMAGFPRAARAVGTAMATNPLPVVIPCHRVVRSDGTLGNYGNDPSWKPRLLEHERAHARRKKET